MARAPKDTKWGYPIAAWEAARDEMRSELRARARARETVTYAELCEAIRVARFRPYSWSFMALLDEVCDADDRRTATVLASLVVRRDTGMPGEGYFRWAARNGFDTGDRERFWREQVEAVWNAYGS